MTHDCDRATECHCYRAGYLRGQQEEMATVASVFHAMEESAGGLAVAASLVFALRVGAGWVELAALEFGSGLVFAVLAGAAGGGWSLRIWRRLKGGASET